MTERIKFEDIPDKHGVEHCKIDLIGGGSNKIDIGDTQMLVYDILKAGITGKIHNIFHYDRDDSYGKKTRVFDIDFGEDCIRIELFHWEDWEEYITISGSINYNTKYDCVYIDFIDSRYRFVFENTITGETNDLVFNVNLDYHDRNFNIEILVKQYNSLWVGFNDYVARKSANK
jgi:hypothetical protein